MEKVMSVEEKIRKAEEIYNRRNGKMYNTYSVKNKHMTALSSLHLIISNFPK